MSVHDSIDSMWASCLEHLLRGRGAGDSRDGDVHGEIIAYSDTLDASKQKTFLCNTRRQLSPAYAAAETLWYLSGESSVKMLARYAPSYKNYADENGLAYGAYGPRVMPYLPKLTAEMKRAPMTRQGVISIWRPDDLDAAGRTPDMPCTLSHQYVLRDGALHMIVTMRSNDVWKGMPYDIFAFTCLQRVVAAHLNARVGLYHHRVGSMHLYSRDANKARESLHASAIPRELRPHGWSLDDTLTTCEFAVQCERMIRSDGIVPDSIHALGDMTHDLVVACENKVGTWRLRTHSELMRCKNI